MKIDKKNKELSIKEKKHISWLISNLTQARQTCIGYGGETSNPRLLEAVTRKLNKYLELL